jgi:hypothetical protein
VRLAAGSCAKPVTSSLWRCISIPSRSHPPKHLTGLYALSASKRPLATRLTQRTKREVKASDVPEVKHTRPEHVCRGCGKTIRRGGTSCADCAIEGATQRLEAAARIGRSVSHTPDPELSKALRVDATREHAQTGIPRPTEFGSRKMFFSKRSCPCLPGFRHQALLRRSAYHAGTPGAFVRAIARILGTGRR